MPINATWIKCDEILFFNSKLELFKSSDDRFMRFILKDTFDPIDVIAAGPYLSFKLKDEPRYYAFSRSEDPGIEIFKIYVYS